MGLNKNSAIFVSLFIAYLDVVAVRADVDSGTDIQALAPYLNKKYRLTSSENFEELMKALGVGIWKRKLGNIAKPVIQLREEDGVFTLSMESLFKNMETKFRLGEEFDELTPDDREVRSVVTLEGTTLVHTQRGAKTTRISREFSDQGVRVVAEVDGIVSVRNYTPV